MGYCLILAARAPNDDDELQGVGRDTEPRSAHQPMGDAQTSTFLIAAPRPD